MSSRQAPPEGRLIRLARRARGLSAEEAARRTKIKLGKSRWYHIEAGYESKDKPVIAPPETLAHMAYVVGVTPEQLAGVGRQDAAEVLREIIRQESQEPPRVERRYSDPGLQAIWEIQELTEQERTAAITLIQALRAAGQSQPQTRESAV